MTDEPKKRKRKKTPSPGAPESQPAGPPSVGKGKAAPLPDMELDAPMRSKGMSIEEWRDKAEQLELLNLERRRRNIHLEPTFYGLPDLLFPKGYYPGKFDRDLLKIVRKKLPYEETDEQYRARQDRAIEDFITGKMFIAKDENIIGIKMIPPMIRLLADLFFGRVSKIILWANRGGGKSLLAAVFIWIMLVYRKRSCLNMGGAGNQARRVYDYTVQFWANVPGLQEGMLLHDPLMERTMMKNGTKLICATSKSTAIGEHIPMFVADEACTDRHGGDHDLMRSMQGCLSEADPTVFLLSTFHLPVGFFADMWDQAEHHGFARYRWDCFDTMEQCKVGLEEATPEDPKALKYCETKCPLTWKEPKRNAKGEIEGEEMVGCRGKARESQGWMSRDSVLEAQRLNAGTRIFPVEHACIRPRREGTIFDPELIDKCLVDSVNLIVDRPKIIGIDWGLTECAMVLVGEWREPHPTMPGYYFEGIAMIDVKFMSGEGVDAVVEQIRKWQLAFGDAVIVRSDASHPYNNRELHTTYGYRVRPVQGDRGDQGKANVARWMGSGLFKMLRGFDLFIEQMKNLRRDMATGKQLKDNKKGEEGDHGPDALRMALMQFDFIKWWKTKKHAAADEDEEGEKTDFPEPGQGSLPAVRLQTPAERWGGQGKPKTNPRQKGKKKLPRAVEQERPRFGGWRGQGMDRLLGGF